ncbi:MAG: thymidine phosphorylase, partial [Candidatus Eisenbacteria bacterium]|nr:thymidine phosphorylase [Candidatus Eisenbacteria bacterium]
GDKLSLIVAPVAAAAGVRVPMVSGRGLGHTGGTLDKLESIPGMRTDFPPDEFVSLVASVGMAIVGQSPQIAPADRRMYALRDVTATIECVPLIVSSILSKKLAADLNALVLDVKVGEGAFMGDVSSARQLALALVSTARRLGLPATSVLTDMSSPLGLTVGNALEVREAIDVLKGGGPEDVRETSLILASRMILMGGLAADTQDAERQAARCLESGGALAVFGRFVEAQGGDPSVIDRLDILPSAPFSAVVKAPISGFVDGINALAAGFVATGLGAGRRRVGEEVDPSVGIEILAPVGCEVGAGDALAMVHAASERDADLAIERLSGAFAIGEERSSTRGRLIEILEPTSDT